jgi:hypothetical protein
LALFGEYLFYIWTEIMSLAMKKHTNIACRFPQLIEAVGFPATAGVATAMMVVFAVLPTIFLQWKGHSLRKAVN